MSVAPRAQVGLLAEGDKAFGGPIVHHVRPEDRPDAALIQIVKDRFDVVHVQRRLAMLRNVRLGVRMLAEVPCLIAAEMEIPDARCQGQHVVDHPLDQLAGPFRKRVEAVRQIRHFPEALVAAG